MTTSSTIWQYCPAHIKLCHYIPVQHLLYSAINRNVHGTSQCGEDIEPRQTVYTYILISVFMLIIVGSTTVHAQKRDGHACDNYYYKDTCLPAWLPNCYCHILECQDDILVTTYLYYEDTRCMPTNQLDGGKVDLRQWMPMHLPSSIKEGLPRTL